MTHISRSFVQYQFIHSLVSCSFSIRYTYTHTLSLSLSPFFFFAPSPSPRFLPSFFLFALFPVSCVRSIHPYTTHHAPTHPPIPKCPLLYLFQLTFQIPIAITSTLFRFQFRFRFQFHDALFFFSVLSTQCSVFSFRFSQFSQFSIKDRPLQIPSSQYSIPHFFCNPRFPRFPRLFSILDSQSSIILTLIISQISQISP
ncbi:hypothetical protein HHX47_DHR1000610 [Lentinula edodes]|nr:hypothetical protein HHX47_DHR1000610 [Lentinula edodes]